MPAGVPVATVSINGARNAGLLALRILGCATDDFAQQVHSDLLDFSKDLRQNAVDKGTALRAKLAEHRAQVAEEEKVQAPAAPKPAPTADPTRDEGDEPQAYVP